MNPEVYYSSELIYDLKKESDLDSNVRRTMDILLMHLVELKLFNLMNDKSFAVWKSSTQISDIKRLMIKSESNDIVTTLGKIF